MNNMKAASALLFLSFFLCSCGSTKEIKTPPFTYGDPVLSKGIEQRSTEGIPLIPATTFFTTDQEVIASLKLANVSGSHRIRWDWHDPQGTLFCSTGDYPLSVSEGSYREQVTAWHSLSVKDTEAAQRPGTWKLHLYLDNALIASKDFTLQSPKPPVRLAGTFPKRKAYAVMVGISRYRYAGEGGLTNLPFADDDAEAMVETLLANGWDDDHIKCLTNEKATQRQIIISLESWLTKASHEDLILLYWSGHGFPDPEDPEKVYFACHDTDPRIPATGYRMDRVREVLKERNAKNVVILADTCHAGKLITRGERGIGVRPYVERIRRERKVPKGWIFMVGADTDRQAIEHSSWSNGAFTHCLLKALRGEADGFESVGPADGVVSMGELRAYLEVVMPDETHRVLGAAKHPIITTSTGDPNIWKLSLSMR